MKNFKKEDLFTIPNILGYIRIILIPVFSYMYITAKTGHEYLMATLVVLISSFTDMFDGMIARKFNMVTEFGKMLDPVADKLTHCAMALCLATRYRLMWVLIVLMAVKEGYMGIMGIHFLKKGRMLDGAMWFGKVCTAVLFTGLVLLFFVYSLPVKVADAIIIFMMIVMSVTLAMYVPVFRKMKKESVR